MAALKFRQQAAFLLGLLTTIFCYFPVRQSGFVYDDRWMLVENPAIRHMRPRAFFTDRNTVALPESGLTSDVYRPLTTLSFALDYRLWTLRPFPYHVENILLHLANGLLLGLLFQMLLGPEAAALAAAVFLLHPLQVQTVAWATQRSGLLSAFFGLLMLRLGSSPKLSPARVVVLWLCTFASLFAKESGVVFAVLLILWRTVRVENVRDRFPPVLVTGLVASVAVFLGCRWQALHQWSQFAEVQKPGIQALALGLMAFPVYLGKLLCPILLRPSYDYPHAALVTLAGSTLIAGGYIFFVLTVWRRDRRVGLALVWILVSLAPALQVLPIRAYVAERFAYVAVGGLALGAGLLWERVRRSRMILGAWLAALTVLTIRAVPEWKGQETLWRFACAQEPGNAFAHASYASTLSDPVQAIAEYKTCLAAHPSPELRLTVVTNMAHLLLRQKQPAEALYWSMEAVRLGPTNVAALFNLCCSASAVGDAERARDAYLRLCALPSAPPEMLIYLKDHILAKRTEEPNGIISPL